MGYSEFGDHQGNSRFPEFIIGLLAVGAIVAVVLELLGIR